jgi:indoleamine 2,3-dioxygenase
MFHLWKSKNPDSWFSVKPNENGFLPVLKPLKSLQKPYKLVNDILELMKLSNPDSLLKQNKLAEYIRDNLPDYTDTIKKELNKQILATLFRDYSFMASAYSLETSHYDLKEGIYGTAREELPSNLAKPLKYLAEKLDSLPWLDYAYGYGLNNAIIKEGETDLGDYRSYETIRMFNGIESESGFINVHVAMNSYTPELLSIQQKILVSANEIKTDDLNYFLNKHYYVLNSIIESLNQMWKACKKSEYLSFRTFIMGQKGNKVMYPNEEIIFNLDKTKESHSYRGETGAQDSIIPSVDSLFQIKYPRNKLTEYLYDLRQYRPKDHQAYIEYNAKMSKIVDLVNLVKTNPECSLAFLKNLNCIRLFRRKHWNLTKKYIIENTKHPVATGGTPITTWLPNQLGATLETMKDIIETLEPKKHLLSESDRNEYITLKLEVNEHLIKIMEEVNELQNEFTQQEHQSFLSRTI